ncbi:MAG: GTPase domain-containing protein [Congregibacter sp.]
MTQVPNNESVSHALKSGTGAELLPRDFSDGVKLPTLWMLGKTGAGKSSLIQKISGSTSVELGNGVRPCTRSTQAIDFPSEAPVVRFLDTRGIGEAGYDVQEELATLHDLSQALVIVAKLGDPAQQSIARVVHKIQTLTRNRDARTACVIHTHADELSSRDRQRCLRFNQELFESAWGGRMPHCCVDLADPHEPDAPGSSTLRELLLRLLPMTIEAFDAMYQRQLEAAAFREIKPEISRFAAAAAASDTVPLLGLLTVPSLQGKMMHRIAQHCGISWSRGLVAEFTGVLGSAIAVKYALHLGGRQAAKLIPVWGQTAGAALSATTSYAATFALGRASFRYLFSKAHETEPRPTEIRSAYYDALRAIGTDNDSLSARAEGTKA